MYGESRFIRFSLSESLLINSLQKFAKIFNRFGLPLELVQEELGRLPRVSGLLEYLIGSGSL